MVVGELAVVCGQEGPSLLNPKGQGYHPENHCCYEKPSHEAVVSESLDAAHSTTTAGIAHVVQAC